MKWFSNLVADADEMRANSETGASARTAAPVLAPVGEIPTTTDGMTDDYIDAARRVGVINAATKRGMILRICAEMGLRVYPLGAVEKFMDAQFGHAKKGSDPTWGWRPLREADRDKLISNRDDGMPNGCIAKRLYHGAVPLPVLLTVERIAEAVPDVHFYVTDKVNATAEEDPFLAVTAAGMNMLIVERWDEPNFKG